MTLRPRPSALAISSLVFVVGCTFTACVGGTDDPVSEPTEAGANGAQTDATASPSPPPAQDGATGATPPPPDDSGATDAGDTSDATDASDASDAADASEAGSDAGIDAGDAGVSYPISVSSVGATNTSGVIGAACIRAPALPQANALYVIGIYEASTNTLPHTTGDRKGPVAVHVTASSSPVTLVLTSYEPVEWDLTVDAGVTIDHVYTSSYYPADTNVVGTTAPVTSIKLGYAYGWSSADNSGGGDFGKYIGSIRTESGALETGFEGKYYGASFTIPYAGDTQISHYEASAACTDKCTVATASFGWTNVAFNASISASGDTATWASGAPRIKGSPGKRCGKHYFEIDFSGVTSTTDVGVRVADSSFDSYPIGSAYDPSLTNDSATHVGVALDLDTGKVFYRTAAGWVSPNGGSPTATTDPTIGATGAYLRLWDYEEVVPIVQLKEGSVHITRTAPFTFPQPTGYAADM